MECLNALTSN